MKKLQEKRYKALSLIRYKLNYLLRKIAGAFSKEKPTIAIVATAPKVGSTWLVKLLRDLYVFNHAVLPEEVRPDPIQAKLIDLDAPATPDFLRGLGENYLIKSHSDPPKQDLPENVKLITIVRDPRDVVISITFFLTHLEERLGGWPELAEMEDDRSRIIHYLKKDVGVINQLEAWTTAKSNNIHLLTYEDLLEKPLEEMRKMVKFLGLNLSESRIQKAVDNNQFAKHSGGREAGKEDKGSFFRKGIAGDWVNYFDEEIVELMKTVHDGRWNKLIVNMGYESSADWSMPQTEEVNS